MTKQAIMLINSRPPVCKKKKRSVLADHSHVVIVASLIKMHILNIQYQILSGFKEAKNYFIMCGVSL